MFFLKKLAEVLPEQTNINEHAIELVDGKQLLYRSIYNIGLVKLQILKTYIKTNLANGFIWPSKTPTGTFIFSVCKSDGSFCLPVGYWRLNNLTVKNRDPLPLIGKSLEWLGQAK